MSRKSERLVNLTIALLNSRRHLTKSEIFSRVYGYEGSSEAMERMFERDKDELRSIGIKIDVEQIDPLFSDETGYRIYPENYALDISGLDQNDLSILAVAISSLTSDNHDLLLRLRALGSDTGLPFTPPILPESPSELSTIVQAIEDCITITFTYRNDENVGTSRTLEPYAVYSRHGLWYVVGRDVDRGALRTFRFDRFLGEVATLHRKPFIKDREFELERVIEPDPRETAVIRVRKGSCLDLRTLATSLEDDGEHEILKIPYISQDYILAKTLWHMDMAVVIAPESLRSAAIQALTKVAQAHE